MRFLPTKIHGIIDYLTGIVLIAAHGCWVLLMMSRVQKPGFPLYWVPEQFCIAY